MNNFLKSKQENISKIIELSDMIDKYLREQERNIDLIADQALFNALQMIKLLEENRMLDLVYFCQNGKYPDEV